MRKIIHVGQMKSGTTFIQNSLSSNREFLLQKGILYPGKLFNQQHACYGICGKNIPWVSHGEKWSELGRELLNDIEQNDGDILISSEALSCMSVDGVDDFVEKVGGIDEVVITIRNFHRVILSAWQQSIKGGGVKSFGEFFNAMREDRALNKGLWKNYSFGETAKLWSKHAEVKIVIAESDKGKNLLLDRFSSACNMPNLEAVKLNASQENKSLKREDVEILRVLNKLNLSMERNEREEYVRWLLSKGMFVASSMSEGERIKLPEENLEESIAWAKEELNKIPKRSLVLGDTGDIVKVYGGDVEYAPHVFESGYDVLKRMNLILKIIHSK